jgi:GNAT superfamily N-acetyltransferase
MVPRNWRQGRGLRDRAGYARMAIGALMAKWHEGGPAGAPRLERGDRGADAVEILPFEPRYRDDFKRLNVEWLEKYFCVEPIDDDVLSHPEEAILEPGGFILLACVEGQIVGTCALINAGSHRFELAKMAVTPRYQGLQIGRRLLHAAIEQFKTMQGLELFLESNSKLAPALALYEANGFRHAPRPDGPSHYQRSDVYMVYQGELSRGRTD